MSNYCDTCKYYLNPCCGVENGYTYCYYEPKVEEPIRRYSFPKLNDIVRENKDDGTEIWSITRKLAAEVLNTEETFVLDKIIEFARASGVDTLYVIDEEFVRSAIIHEFERRKNDGR